MRICIMAACAATAPLFPVAAASSKSSIVPGRSDNLDTRRIGSSKLASSGGGLKVQANPQFGPKCNETAVAYPPASEIFNTLLAWKPLVDPSGFGKTVQGGLVFQQSFLIRSYEIGINGTTTIESFMNHLQETALNHAKTVGLLSTKEAFSERILIWVVAKMQIVVERYPTWGDVVQVDTWIAKNGKNGMRRDWLVRDMNTGETLARASSLWVMMNRRTRKLSKIPDDDRVEIEPLFMDCDPIIEDDGRKIPKLDDSAADYVRDGLAPRWNDLDLNQHVNNVKYIGWILESSISALENHELAGITLEYRKECRKDDVLQSLTSVNKDCTEGDLLECFHLLRLDSGAEIARGRTMWRPKRINCLESMDQSPSVSM